MQTDAYVRELRRARWLARESLQNHVRALGALPLEATFVVRSPARFGSPLSTVEPGSHPPNILDAASTSLTHRPIER